MSRSTYPLEPLRTLRTSEEERAQRALTHAISQREERTAARARDADALRRHRVEEARRREEGGLRSGAEWRREMVFREHQGRREEALEARLRSSRVSELRAMDEVREARRALTLAAAKRLGVDTHRERWRTEDRRRREAADERESEESGRNSSRT